jgi:hypothetical protein
MGAFVKTSTTTYCSDIIARDMFVFYRLEFFVYFQIVALSKSTSAPNAALPPLGEGFGMGAHMAIINYFRDFFKGKNLTFETVEIFFSLFSLETQ